MDERRSVQQYQIVFSDTGIAVGDLNENLTNDTSHTHIMNDQSCIYRKEA